MSTDRTSRLGRTGRWIRLQLLRMIRENSTPGRTGLGFSLGMFIGIFPSFLLGGPVAFVIAGRFGLNRAAALAGTTFTNPLTAPVLYSTSAWLGRKLLGREPDGTEVEGFLNLIREYGLAFLLGNTLVALACAAVFGLAVYFTIRRLGPTGLRGVFRRTRRAAVVHTHPTAS